MPSYVLHSAENRKSRSTGVVITILAHLLLLFVLLKMTLLSTVIIPSLSVELLVEPDPEREEMRIEKLALKPLASAKKVADTPPVPTKAAEVNDQSGDVETPVEKPVEIDKRAIFHSDDMGEKVDNAAGEGIDNRALFSGDRQARAGVSEEGTSVSLNGRSVVGVMEQPVNMSNREGRVVVEITVDQNGKVIEAQIRAKGTTIQDAALWKAAEEAARQTLFNTDLNSPPLQMGTITYVFKLK
jgi:TonB family protein